MASGKVRQGAGKVILLLGKAEARFLAPSKKDQADKHLYSYGNQLYMFWPYQGQRCIVTYHGLYVGEYTIIVYGEDCIHPHIERTWPEHLVRRIGNTRSRFEATIKEERAGNYKNPKKTAGILGHPIIKKHWGLILVGVVLLIAFVKSRGVI